MQKRILLGVGISGLLLVALCAIVYFILSAPKPAEVEWGLNLPLPDNPIVFRVENGSDTTLGFIDPDGSNFTTREIDISLTRDRSFLVPEQTTWGPDGTFLVTGLTNYWLSAGEFIPVVITDNGETRFCKDFMVFGSVWGIDSTHLLTANDRAEGASRQTQIVTLNMETCQIEDVLYTNSNGIGYFAMSSDGWIAHEKSGIGIVVLDDQGRIVFEIDEARLPNWSRDGEWLAYDSYNQGMQDGIKIVDRNGNNTQIITDLGSHPWWSLDGEWLVYSTSYDEIYKININTKEKMLLYDGGRYPTWHWGLIGGTSNSANRSLLQASLPINCVIVQDFPPLAVLRYSYQQVIVTRGTNDEPERGEASLSHAGWDYAGIPDSDCVLSGANG